MSTWCGVDFVATSYFDETGGRTGGGIVTPLVTGDAEAGIFVHGGFPRQVLRVWRMLDHQQFDVLDKTAIRQVRARYPVTARRHYYAAIASSRAEPGGYDVNDVVRIQLQYIRDDVHGPIDRCDLAEDVFAWMQNPSRTSLRRRRRSLRSWPRTSRTPSTRRPRSSST